MTVILDGAFMAPAEVIHYLLPGIPRDVVPGQFEQGSDFGSATRRKARGGGQIAPMQRKMSLWYQ